MATAEQQARLEEAFERIEETILPCIAMMLETLLDASASMAETDWAETMRASGILLWRPMAGNSDIIAELPIAVVSMIE